VLSKNRRGAVLDLGKAFSCDRHLVENAFFRFKHCWSIASHFGKFKRLRKRSGYGLSLPLTAHVKREQTRGYGSFRLCTDVSWVRIFPNYSFLSLHLGSLRSLEIKSAR
jgi:hypothetical protein